MFNSKKSSQPFTMDNFIKQLHKISTHLSYIYSPFTDIELLCSHTDCMRC